MTGQLLNDESIISELDISHLVIEDDTPVDNLQSEKQQGTALQFPAHAIAVSGSRKCRTVLHPQG